MKRTLVPLDGSPLAETILPVVEEWAREEGAEVFLLWSAVAHHDIGPQMRSLEEGEAYLKGVADRLKQRGLKHVRTLVWYRDPVGAITQAAEAKTADLIAMATHGRGGVSRLLLGSVASGVVRSAQVPVLLIRGSSAWQPSAMGRILVPLDGSEASEGILPVVEGLAGSRDLHVTLLHVVEPPSSTASRSEGGWDERRAAGWPDVDQYLAKAAKPLKDKGLRAGCVIRTGRPADVIAAYATQEQVDLIVMATHGWSGFRRLLFGSVAEGVLRRAAVPVVLFKRGLSPVSSSGDEEWRP